MTKHIVIISLLAAATCLTSCSKVDLNSGNTAPPEVDKHAIEAARIVEIDRLLSAPLTGTPADSDRRASLRAERAALVNPQSVIHNAQPIRIAQQPVSEVRNSSIVVAGDSQGNHDPHEISRLEAMTPTEREHYYKQLRLTNPHVVVPVYVR